MCPKNDASLGCFHRTWRPWLYIKIQSSRLRRLKRIRDDVQRRRGTRDASCKGCIVQGIPRARDGSYKGGIIYGCIIQGHNIRVPVSKHAKCAVTFRKFFFFFNIWNCLFHFKAKFRKTANLFYEITKLFFHISRNKKRNEFHWKP
jgi:hypothetical protein